jgi:nucleotide-binding universal stress UspA family protein
MSIRKILVALDGSERAPIVLDAALELARAVRAKLVLFRAVGLPIDLSPGLFMIAPEDAPALLEKEAMQALSHLAKPVPPELLGGIHVAVGQPWDAICAAAKREDVDVVVIGSHGHHFIDRILGTTAARVVNHADRSVLVVYAAGAQHKG